MNLTIAFIIFLVVIIAVYDFWVIFKKGKSESISAHIIRLSHKYPSIPFLLGFVCGHLFWSFNTESLYKDVKCYEVRENGEEILIKN